MSGLQHLFLLPIEPLHERYTESWYRNFPQALRDYGFDVTVIDGTPLTSTIEVGSFLDMNSTVAYKNSQLAKVAQLFHEKKVPDGSAFFVLDVEFWGIESLRLMADMNGINISLFGFLHAASYTQDDAFSVAAAYQKYTEIGWLAVFDRVFVGSYYHKRIVNERRLKPYAGKEASKFARKITVVGNPMFASDYASYPGPKKNQIVLPNRFDWGKRPDLSLAQAVLIKDKHPDWEIVVTTGKQTLASDRPWLRDYAYSLQDKGIITIKTGLTKAQYHQTLAESKVMMSFSIEESFGYCIAEAIHYNCEPLIRKGLSHDEFYLKQRNYFVDEGEVLAKTESIVEAFDDANEQAMDTTGLLNKFFEAPARMAYDIDYVGSAIVKERRKQRNPETSE